MQAEICMLREAGISTFKYKKKKYLEAGKLKQMTIDKGQDRDSDITSRLLFFLLLLLFIGHRELWFKPYPNYLL